MLIGRRGEGRECKSYLKALLEFCECPVVPSGVMNGGFMINQKCDGRALVFLNNCGSSSAVKIYCEP